MCDFSSISLYFFVMFRGFRLESHPRVPRQLLDKLMFCLVLTVSLYRYCTMNRTDAIDFCLKRRNLDVLALSYFGCSRIYSVKSRRRFSDEKIK